MIGIYNGIRFHIFTRISIVYKEYTFKSVIMNAWEKGTTETN